MELEIGVRRIERRDPRQGGMLRSWLSGHVLPEFEGRVLPVDTAVALRFTCRTRGLTVTR